MAYLFAISMVGVFPAYGVIMFKTGKLAYKGLIGFWFQVIAFGLCLTPWSIYALSALKEGEPMR